MPTITELQPAQYSIDISKSGTEDVKPNTFNGVDNIILVKHVVNDKLIPDELKQSWEGVVNYIHNGGNNSSVKEFMSALGQLMVNQGSTASKSLAPNSKLDPSMLSFPLPNSLDFTYSNNYSTSELTLEMTLLNTFNTVTAKLSQSLNTTLKSAIDIAANIAKRQGSTINTNILNVYKGPSPRAMNLSMSFIPNNRAEYDKIKLYITSLKRSSLAHAFLALDIIPFLTQRYVFTIDFVGMSGNKLKQLFNDTFFVGNNSPGFYINSIETNIGAGNALFYDDGAFKEVKLTINLIERLPLYQEDILRLSKIKVSK